MKRLSIGQHCVNQGDRDADSLLGLMYCQGRYVSKDFQKAVTFLKKASYKGCPIAMLDLGELYLNGKGVKQDNARAYSWCSLAHAFGNIQAMDVIINSGRDMKDIDIDKAKAVIEKIASNLNPVPHWADSIFEEYVTRY